MSHETCNMDLMGHGEDRGIRVPSLSLLWKRGEFQTIRIAPSNSFIGSPPFPWSSLCLSCRRYKRLQAAPSLPLMIYASDLRRRGTIVGLLEVTARDEVECDMRCASSECASRVWRLRSLCYRLSNFPKSREEWNDKSRHLFCFPGSSRRESRFE